MVTHAPVVVVDKRFGPVLPVPQSAIQPTVEAAIDASIVPSVKSNTLGRAAGGTVQFGHLERLETAIVLPVGGLGGLAGLAEG